MKLHVRFSAELSTHDPTPAVFMVEVDPSNEILNSDLTWTPNAYSETFVDVFGNTARRLLLPGGDVQVEYQATVSAPTGVTPPDSGLDPDVMTLPADVLQYILPSRYCPSDRMELMAGELFGNSRPGLARVQDICSWVNEHILYQYGTSNVSTSAFETATERVGVCRDFAHLAITFCRTLRIPARYVSGYCLDLEPQDLHAYVEAYVGGQWVAFDPTWPSGRPALVKIAAGLDAATCAWCTLYSGGISNSMSVEVIRVVDE